MAMPRIETGRGFEQNQKRATRIRNTVIALAAAQTVLAGRLTSASGSVLTWDPTTAATPAGGSGSWDLVTGNWYNGAPGAVWTNGFDAVFGGTAGTVNVASISLETGTVTVSGYAFSGGTINLATTVASYVPGFALTVGSSSLNINSVLTGNQGASFGGISYSGTITLGANSVNNSYTGPTIIKLASVYAPYLAADGTNSSLGSSGSIQIGASSASDFFYTGSGGGTNRQFIDVGTATVAFENAGTGAVTFSYTGAAVSGTGNRNIVLYGSGNTGNYAQNVFAEAISDLSGGTTMVSKGSASVWGIYGTNTYSGGTTINSGTTSFNNAQSFGTGSIVLAASSLISAVSPVTLSNPISSSTFALTLATPVQATSVTGTVNYTSAITGSGAVTLSSGSYKDYTVEMSNDTNTFTGAVTIGAGNYAFTSIAEAGTPSSLGEGASNITASASNSSIGITYLGTGNSTTTRGLVQASAGGTATTLTLYASGTGPLGLLDSGVSLRSNTGVSTLSLAGSNTGANTIAEVINDGTATASSTNVIKSGGGAWTLTGTNTYTGYTTVSGGSLTVDASTNTGAGLLGSPTITIATGATLKLISAGSTPSVLLPTASLSVTGSTTYSHIELDLAKGATQAIGAFVVNGTAQDPGLYGSAQFFGDLGVTDTTTLTAEQQADLSYFIAADGGFNAAPEPASATLILLASGGLIARRRRRV